MMWLSWQEGLCSDMKESVLILVLSSQLPHSLSLCEIPGSTYKGSLAGYLCILRSVLEYKHGHSSKEPARTVRLLSWSDQAVPLVKDWHRIGVWGTMEGIWFYWVSPTHQQENKDILCSSLLLRFCKLLPLSGVLYSQYPLGKERHHW